MVVVVAGGWVTGGAVEVVGGGPAGTSRLPSLPRGRVKARPLPGSTSVKFWMTVVLAYTIVIDVPEEPGQRWPVYRGVNAGP